MKIFFWHEISLKLKPGKYTENLTLPKKGFNLFEMPLKFLKNPIKWLKNKFTLKLELKIDDKMSINESLKILDGIKEK